MPEDFHEEIGKLKSGQRYMDKYVNPPEFLEAQRKKKAAEIAQMKRFPEEPTRDVLGFLLEQLELEGMPPPSKVRVGIISRRRKRFILNEDALVRATLEKRCQAWCEERDTTSCPAAVRSELKTSLEEEWFARMLPTVQVTDVGWNVADKTVLVGSLAEGTLARVRKRFFRTFGLRLVPWSPLDILDDKQQVDALHAEYVAALRELYGRYKAELFLDKKATFRA